MNESAPRETCPECGLEIPAGTGCLGCSLRLALSPEALTPMEAKRPLPPGLKSRFFGDYEILDEIARGGMGVVYRARQLSLNRLVALKMIQSHHLLSDEARLRFRVEIEAVAQLHHPHIVSLYESGEHDGAHYFTMRLVEGGTLSERITDFTSPISNRDIATLLVKIARAVHYAHQRGILHRDLKPSNILVDQQGEPHIADFGLAKSLDHDSGFTFTSSVLGSPNYMSPEQATGQTRQLTTAVDVYGLGAILYHLLAGRPPFQAKTPIETLRQVVDHDPVPPRSLNPRADFDLETIALKCLRKEPAARYGTAEELALDLERWLAGRPILARPLGPLAVAWRWSRRHPAAAVLGVALSLALTALVVGTGLTAMHIRRADQKSDASLRKSLLREAGSLRLGSEMGQREESLRLLREASVLGGPPEFRRLLRNELLATLARTELVFVPAPFSDAAPDPGLNRLDARCEWLASVEHDTNIVIRSATNGTVLHRFTSPNDPVVRVEGFGSRNRFLALRHAASLSVWALENGARCLTRPGTNHTFAFHPREDTLLVQDAPNEAVLLELPSGRERWRWTAPASRPSGRPSGWHALVFSPDGGTLAGASGTSWAVELLNPDTGQQLRLLTNWAHALAMDWSPGGGQLAVATADGKVSVWEPKTGTLRWRSPPMDALARSVAFHPQREWLAVAREDDRVRLIDLAAQNILSEFTAAGGPIAFDSSGNRLGPLRSARQWGWLEMRRPDEFASFSVARPFLRESNRQFSVAQPLGILTAGRFSADGRMLAVGDPGIVILCDPENGTRFRVRQDWRIAACVFHPQEKHLLTANLDGLLRHRPRWSQDGRLSFLRHEVINPGGQWHALDITPDGRRFAAYDSTTHMTQVFDHTLTNHLASCGPHVEAANVTLSPEGRWLTTGGRNDRSVMLWDVSNGNLIMTRPVGHQPRGTFSSDGRWLAVTGERFELRETGTWKPAPPLPFGELRPVLGAAAFSPDSRILAIVVGRFTVHLFDLRRFESLGMLRPPGAAPMLGLAFSPDGSKLAATGAEARVAVWNLRALQERLAEFGLAWDIPESLRP